MFRSTFKINGNLFTGKIKMTGNATMMDQETVVKSIENDTLNEDIVKLNKVVDSIPDEDITEDSSDDDIDIIETIRNSDEAKMLKSMVSTETIGNFMSTLSNSIHAFSTSMKDAKAHNVEEIVDKVIEEKPIEDDVQSPESKHTLSNDVSPMDDIDYDIISKNDMKAAINEFITEKTPPHVISTKNHISKK